MDFDLLESEYQHAFEWVRDSRRPVHLMGIGGVGMAGLALLLQARGFSVSGCDVNSNTLTGMLSDRGIKVFAGNDRDHLTGAVRWAVRSAAVDDDNDEARAAAAAGIPLFRRGAVLAALLRDRPTIAVAGTHGKTTTTAFIAQVMLASGLQAGYFIGGETGLPGSVAAGGSPDIPMPFEADESDGTLSLYEPDIAVVTNIDFDHVENFSDSRAFEECFRRFVDRTRRCLLYCADDVVATRLAVRHSKAVAFGLGVACDYRATILEQAAGKTRFTVALRGQPVGEVVLPSPGVHNVLNALAALAACVEGGVPIGPVLASLAMLERPHRRYETLIESRGRRIISDYAHHPTEIRALLQTAHGEHPKRILAVFQPHRYTRTAALGNDFVRAFEGADQLVLLPVYAASESPLPGGHSADLYARLRSQSSKRIWLADSLLQVEQWLSAQARRDDLILIAGAGSIEQVGLNLRTRWTREPPSERDAATDQRLRLIQAVKLPDDRVKANWPLATRTTLGVGGAADLGVKVMTSMELAAVLAWASDAGMPLRVLGGGSNLVVSDLGVRALVIRLAGPDFTALSLSSDGSLEAGAAVPLARLAQLSRSNRAAGFGFLTGIPGTVGGAICMNTGAWGSEIGNRVIEVRGLDSKGLFWCRRNRELEFTYRFCKGINPGDVVTAVRLRPATRHDPSEPVAMAEHARRRAWMRGKSTAGSIFRNPSDQSAGVLLEAAGCKGLRIGDAYVCREHANVIACGATARASDVLALMQTMRNRVMKNAGMELSPEVICWT